MRRVWWAAMLWFPTAAWAARPVSLHEALEAAEASNPSIRRGALGVTASEASLLSAVGSWDPSLTADGRWRRSSQEGFFQGFPYKVTSRDWSLDAGLAGALGTGTTYAVSYGVDRNFSEYRTDFGSGLDSDSLQDTYTANTSVTVTQKLLRGVVFAYNVHHVTLARRGVALAELEAERTRQRTLADTASAYWSWWYAAELAEIATDAVAVAEEAHRVGSLRVESGELAPVERTRLEAALVQAQADALTAEIASHDAADALLLRMGEAPGQDVVPSSEAVDVPLDVDLGRATEVALAQNLDLLVAKADQERADLDHRQAKHGMLPELSASASAGLGAQADTFGGATTGMFGSDAFPFFQVGGSFAVPLGNRASRGDAHRTAATAESARITVEEVERTVRSSVAAAVRKVESAREKIALADLNVRLAEETLAAEEALADVGRAIQKDVLESRAELKRARAEATKARADLRVALVELLYLQGQIDVGVP